MEQTEFLEQIAEWDKIVETASPEELRKKIGFTIRETLKKFAGAVQFYKGKAVPDNRTFEKLVVYWENEFLIPIIPLLNKIGK